jgi:hypothetical protein
MDVATIRQAAHELLESSSNPVLDQTLRMRESIECAAGEPR